MSLSEYLTESVASKRSGKYGIGQDCISFEGICKELRKNNVEIPNSQSNYVRSLFVIRKYKNLLKWFRDEKYLGRFWTTYEVAGVYSIWLFDIVGSFKGGVVYQLLFTETGTGKRLYQITKNNLPGGEHVSTASDIDPSEFNDMFSEIKDKFL